MKKNTLATFCILAMAGLTVGGQNNFAHAAPLYAADGTLVDPLAPTVNEPPAIAMDNVSVQDTVKLSLAYHQSLKIAQSNRESAEYQLRRAKAGWGPSADVSMSGGINFSNSFWQSEPANSTATNAGAFGMEPKGAVSLSITQPLWDGFATSSRVKAGESTVESLSSRVFDTATSTALDAIIAHVDVLRRRSIVTLARNNVEQHETMLASQRQRVNSGTAPTSDVTQTQGRLARARASLSQTMADLEAAEAQYVRMTGLEAPANMQEVEMPSIMYIDAAQLFTQALTTNPKVKAFKLDVQTSMYSRDLSKASFQPNVSFVLTPSFNYSSNPMDTTSIAGVTVQNPVDNDMNMGVDARIALRWNVFNSFADTNNLRSANTLIRESQQKSSSFNDDLRQEIENTFYSFRTYGEQSAYYTQASKYNRLTRQAYGEQFSLGVRSLTDILDVESEYFNSATEELTAKSNVVVGGYRMVALSGELLPMLAIEPSEYMQGENALAGSDFSGGGVSLDNSRAIPTGGAFDPNSLVDPITGEPLLPPM